MRVRSSGPVWPGCRQRSTCSMPAPRSPSRPPRQRASRCRPSTWTASPSSTVPTVRLLPARRRRTGPRFGLGEQIIQVTEPRVVYPRSADRMVPLPEEWGWCCPPGSGRSSAPGCSAGRRSCAGPTSSCPDTWATTTWRSASSAPPARPAVIERLADPLIGGTTAPRRGAASTSVLPILRSHERNSRSLILASLKSGHPQAAADPLRTLRGGLADLVDAVTVHLRAQPGYRERFGAAADCSTHDVPRGCDSTPVR